MCEAAWAAGFFDGEGHVYSRPGYNSKFSTYRSLGLTVSQADIRPLERFKNAVGCGTIYGPRIRNGKTWKPCWVYKANPTEVYKVFEVIGPFLCDPKRVQFASAFASREKRD